MSTRICTALVFSLLLTASLFGQATVIHENQTVPIEFQITTCEGEIVDFVGESQLIVHSTGNENGGNTITQIRFHLVGTSADGTRYVVNEHVMGAITTGSANTFISEARLVAVSEGSEDNLLVHTAIRTIVSASGEVTVEILEFTRECQG